MKSGKVQDQSQIKWISDFIWNIADNRLRDVYVRGKYRDVILPFTVLRRLDAVLEETKQKVLERKRFLDKNNVAEQDACSWLPDRGLSRPRDQPVAAAGQGRRRPHQAARAGQPRGLLASLAPPPGLRPYSPVPLPLHGGEILFARAPSRPSAELPRSAPPTPGLRPAVPSPIAALRGTNPSTGEKSPGSCQKEETAGVTSAEVGLTGGSVVCGVGERTRTSTGL